MKRQIILVISLVCGLVAALLTRTYLTVKENEIKAERAKLLKQYGTIKVVTFARDVPSGAVLTEADLALRFAPEIGLRGQAVTDKADVLGRKLVIGHK